MEKDVPSKLKNFCRHEHHIETGSDIVCSNCGLVLGILMLYPKETESETTGFQPKDLPSDIRDLIFEVVEKFNFPPYIAKETCELLKRTKKSLNKSDAKSVYTRRNLSVCAYALHAALNNENIRYISLNDIMNKMRPWPNFVYLPKTRLEEELYTLRKKRHFETTPSQFLPELLRKSDLQHFFSGKKKSLLKLLADHCNIIAKNKNFNPLALMASLLQQALPKKSLRDSILNASQLSQSTLYRAREKVFQSRECREIIHQLKKELSLKLSVQD